MKLKSVVLVISIIMMGSKIIAQQLPQSNLYSFNKYNINPAYTGFNKCIEIYGSHLSQWVGLGNSPRTSYLSVHSGIGKNMGLGGGIILDNASFVSRFSAKLSYAYRIKLGEEHDLRFGLSAGLFQVKIDATSAIVDDVTDEVVSGGIQRGMSFNSDFGVFYNLKGFQFGVSIPQIFETKANLRSQTIDGYAERRHVVTFIGYDLKLNEKWNVEPSILYKTAQNGLNQVDFNALVTYNRLISLGVGYRTNVGMLARLGINIKDKFILGYAYEFAGNNISSYTSGSHEIMLGIKFCKNKSQLPENKKENTITKVVEDEIAEPEITPEPNELVEKTTKVDSTATNEVVAYTPKSHELSAEEKKAFDMVINFPMSGTNLKTPNNELDKIAAIMKEHLELKIKLIGHSCDSGTEEVKKRVAENRSKSVKSYLVKNGINADRISVIGMSDSSPVVANNSDENRLKNRRVEVELME